MSKNSLNHMMNNECRQAYMSLLKLSEIKL